MYPELCVQSLVTSKWWVKHEANSLCRGALIQAFVPHVDQTPYGFELVGRNSADKHDTAIVKVGPIKVDQPLKPTSLPVAAMPLNGGEIWGAYRAKKRPCLVLSCDHPIVNSELTKGMAHHSTAQTCVVAPYYGVTKNHTRSGYRKEFVERVQQCEYPQFFWDHLPFVDGEESILRLDQMQPIGTHHHAYKLSTHKLSDEALSLIDDMLSWLVWGGVAPDSQILAYRELIEAL